MRILLAGMAWMLLAAAPSLAQSLPTPTFADVQVARIDDLGKPFELKANVYLPAGAGAATPLVLYIHGKGGAYDDPRDQLARRILGALLPRGIAVARIDYRRSGRMPAMLMDTKAYLRFFRAHAGTYHIDPNRIGIWGMSRGGNLSQSSKVDASVVESPLTDMFLSSDDKAASMFGDYLGTGDADSKAIVAAYRKHDTASPWWRDVERIEQVNPLNYVNKDSPPALIICGGLDPANVVLNCTAFFDRYIQAAAPASYYALSIGTHVRVGSDIEAASVNWLAERLSSPPPPLFPDPKPTRP